MNKQNKYLYGTRIKKTDYMHKLFGYAMPNRCDNEAFFALTIDLTQAQKLIDKLNKANPDYKYTMFQLVIAAICKITILKPKLNRFYKGHKYYQRNCTTVGFVVKNKFDENSPETVAVINAKEEDNLLTVHDFIQKQIFECKANKKTDKTDTSFNLLNSIPNWVLNIAAPIIIKMDKWGKVPNALFDCNPYYASWWVANLGSIGLNSVYHHLANYGTNSCFCTMGKIGPKEFINKDGSKSIKQGLDIKITIDERIVDGYYYHKAMELLEKILLNPELLLDDFATPIA